MGFKSACPFCGAKFQAEDVHLNKTGRCSKCGEKFKVQPLTAQTAVSDVQSEEEEDLWDDSPEADDDNSWMNETEAESPEETFPPSNGSLFGNSSPPPIKHSKEIRYFWLRLYTMYIKVLAILFVLLGILFGVVAAVLLENELKLIGLVPPLFALLMITPMMIFRDVLMVYLSIEENTRRASHGYQTLINKMTY